MPNNNVNAERAGVVNQRDSRLKQQQSLKSDPKVEEQYFKSEAEAQDWEDRCLSNLEAPGPKQFLQNVASSTSSQKNNKISKVKGSSLAVNTSEKAQKVSGGGEQSFKMKFKTEICKFWQLNGSCEYAETCSFAHGNHELKQRTDKPRNYKTKQCKRFHKELYCPYGPRCQFLHDKVPVQVADKKKSVLKVRQEPAVKSIVSYSHLLNTAEPLAFDID